MNGTEIMQMLRTLLDDGREFFPTLPEALSSINEAQNVMLKRFIAENNERALRPLYTASSLVASGTTITGVAAPRACHIYYANTLNYTRHYASYKNYDVFLNYTDPNFTVGGGMPETAYWTFANDTLLFHPDSGSYRGQLWYIAYPSAFTYGIGNLADTFDFPVEFHPKIVALAAQIINEADVLEYDRSEVPDPRKKLTIETFGGL